MSSANISCLKHRETTLAEAVKSAPLGVLARRESASKYLHSEESKNEDEQNEQDEQRVDGGDGVHEGLYQVSHRAPVSEVRGNYLNGAISDQPRPRQVFATWANILETRINVPPDDRQ